MKIERTKIIASIITIIVLGLIILAGPAQAFILGLTIDGESDVNKGDDIKFIATLDIKAVDEYLPIKNLTLNLDGPVNKRCIFDVSGNKLNGCNGMDIEKIDVSSYYGYGYGYGSNYGYGYNFGYGYGYGYGYGAGGGEVHLEYEITLDTQYYLPGEYETQLQALIGDKRFSEDGKTISINASSEASNSDSYSGTQGNFVFTNTETEIDLSTSSDVSGDITVNRYSTIPGNASGFTLPALGKFIEIDADQEIINNLDETTIRVYYTDAEVTTAGVNESSLRLYYYNETDDSWEKFDGNDGTAPDGGVNTTNNYVWALSNHFSLWGLFGNSKTTSTSPSDSSSDENQHGGTCQTTWVCTDWSECVNGTQTRTCKKMRPFCKAGTKPIEERSCGEVLEGETKGLISRITGAVIGALGTTTGMIITAFLLLLAGAFVVMKRFRKRKDEKGKTKLALFILLGLWIINDLFFVSIVY